MDITALVKFKNSAIYETRIELGMNQGEFAKLIGTSTVRINEWENFKNYPLRPGMKKDGGRRQTAITDKIVKNLIGISGKGYDELFPPEFIQAVDEKRKMNGLEIKFQAQELGLPEWAKEKLLPPPDELYLRKEKERLIREAFEKGCLTDRQKLVLRLRFGLEDGRECTLAEIADRFKLSNERIRQIEAKALRILKHPKRATFREKGLV